MGFQQFFFWAELLERSGYICVNPARIDCQKWIDEGWIYTPDQYEDVLAKDLEILAGCDALFLLEEWRDSPGARREKARAEELGLPIFRAEDIELGITIRLGGK